MIKQHSSEKDWEIEWNEATKRHSFAEIVALKEKTERIIAQACRKPYIIGYTGGKDSLVLRHMAENCLDNPMFISCILQNEFPRFDEWLHDTAPRNIVYVYDDKLSLDFLNNNLQYLFPISKKEQGAYVTTFRRPTYRYLMEHGIHQFMTGKRYDDGNTCGKEDITGMHYTYMRATDMKTLNPMADWKHSHLLAYIQYFKIELPEIYSYPNGFRFGTHPWTERRRLGGLYRNTFDEIMKLDDTIIPAAAKKLEIADLYLHGKLDH